MYAQRPLPPLIAMGMFVTPLISSVIFLLSPLRTLELHDTEIVPDWRDSHVYVSMVTTSGAVGLILTGTTILLLAVALDFRLTVSVKLKVVSVVTLGAVKVAVAWLGLVMLMAGAEGVVWVQAKLSWSLLSPCAVLEPCNESSAPTRCTAANWAAAATGKVCDVGVLEGVPEVAG